MAKGWAGRQREHSTHRGKRMLPTPVSRTLLAFVAGVGFNESDAEPSARLSEEPGAGKPHAGICEGAPGNGCPYLNRCNNPQNSHSHTI